MSGDVDLLRFSHENVGPLYLHAAGLFYTHMAEKLRSVNTKFWEDPWVETLDPPEKLLFLYFLTNSKTNMLGIYEVSISKISFETGLTRERVSKALEGFERVGKVYFIENYIVLPNFMKNQSMNTNMKKSAMAEFEKVPLLVKKELSLNPSEGFESLCKAFETLSKIEIEKEIEEEEEIEKEKKVKNASEALTFPFEDSLFIEWWDKWKIYKKEQHGFKYKSQMSEQAALMDLQKKSDSDLITAIEIIQQSIAQGYKGLFELKDSKNGQGQQSILGLTKEQQFNLARNKNI